MSLLRGGAYARDKNTSVRVCAKNAGGAYVRGGRIRGTLRYMNKTQTVYFSHLYNLRNYVCVATITYFL